MSRSLVPFWLTFQPVSPPPSNFFFCRAGSFYCNIPFVRGVLTLSFVMFAPRTPFFDLGPHPIRRNWPTPPLHNLFFSPPHFHPPPCPFCCLVVFHSAWRFRCVPRPVLFGPFFSPHRTPLLASPFLGPTGCQKAYPPAFPSLKA